MFRRKRVATVRQLVHPASPLHEARARNLKAHWWWLQNEVWGRVLGADYHGDVVYLEEDHVVSPDFFDSMRVLCGVKRGGVVADVSFAVGGSYYTDGGASLTEAVHRPGFMNTGYAFNRTVYTALRDNADSLFWEAGASNDWDETLAALAASGRIGTHQLMPRVARVMNIGKLGIHRTQQQAELREKGRFPVSGDRDPATAADWRAHLVVEEGDSAALVCKTLAGCGVQDAAILNNIPR